jgi:hypothetical protein
MKTIRNLRGSWPSWCADIADNGQVVFIYIRHGEVRIGEGPTEEAASSAAVEVASGPGYAGVTDVVDALNVLRGRGYHYVTPR